MHARCSQAGSVLLATVLAGSFACASSGRLSAQQRADLSAARTLVLQGCFDCLVEARVTYDALSSVKSIASTARRGAFEASVLLALRARHLGMSDDLYVQEVERRAAAVHADDSVARPPAPRSQMLAASVYVSALALINGDRSWLANEARDTRLGETRAHFPHDEMTPAARAALDTVLPADVVAQSLALAIDCEDARSRKNVRRDLLLAVRQSALLRFALAMCGFGPAVVSSSGPPSAHASLRQEDPRWTDTLVFEARHEMTRRPAADVVRASVLFEQAHLAFPQSLSIALSLAQARNALTEFEGALMLFDEVLAAQAGHREALLGRVMSLSYLTRAEDAIAAATQMIDLGSYYLGDAFYWRAWNRFTLQRLPEAWDDVERAGRLMVSTTVSALAGHIAYARRDFPTAVQRFTRAFELDATNCDAVWSESLVHVDTQAWTQAAPRFAVALRCFGEDVIAARREAESIVLGDTPHPSVLRRLAAATKRAETSQHRRAQAAFNAASSYLRLREKTAALQHLEVAATHPLLQEKATALRETVLKLP